MKSVFSVGLLISLLLPLLLKIGVIISFIANQNYISQNLCENRDKPELHCEGTCVFMKKLKLTENKPTKEDLPVEIINFKLANFLVPEQLINNSTCYIIQKISKITLYLNILPDPFIGEIFHPPRKQA